MDETNRRAFLAAVGSAATGLAGCVSDDGNAEPVGTTTNTTTNTNTTTEATTTKTGTETETETAEPDGLVIEDPVVPEDQLPAGEAVGVDFIVTNPGDEAVSEEVTVMAADGSHSTTYELSPGDEVNASVSFPVWERGRHDVFIDDEVVGTLRVGRSDYAMFKYDAANTGRAFGTVASSASDVTTLLSTDEEAVAGVVSNGETVIAWHPGESAFVAVDVTTGERVWTDDSTGFTSVESTVLVDGRLLAAGEFEDGSRGLRALSTQDRSTLWTAPWPVEGMTHGNGVVYVAWVGLGARLTAIRAADGEELWSTELDLGDGDPTVHHLTAPAVDEGALYTTAVTDSTGVVCSVHLQSGEQQWATDLGGGGVSPAVVGDDVYVRSTSGLHLVSRGDGSLGYSGELHPGTSFSRLPGPTAALADGTLYGCTDQDKLQALEVDSDRQVWATSVGEPCGSASPVVVDETVVFKTREGTVRGFETADGSETLNVALDGVSAGGPAFVAEGRVVATTTNGLYAVDVTGE